MKRKTTNQLIKELQPLLPEVGYIWFAEITNIIEDIYQNDKAQREEIKQLKAKLKQQEADK